MLFSSRNYAIGMAHYQIAGGVRTLIFLLIAYVALAATIIGFAVYNADPGALPRVLVPVATLFLVLEAFGLVTLGSIRVAACIRTDMQTNMIESHRQMPVPAWRAMMGYLFGSTVQLLAVGALNVPVMAGLQKGAGFTMDNFVLGQMVLAAFAVFVWALSAMGSLMFKQAMPLMVLVFVFGSCSSMALRSFGILPGASLLAAPFLGETIFDLSHGLVNVRSAYPAALAAQGALAVLFFIGACRRYRGTYLTTFNVPMGAALVAIWCGLSAVAIRLWPELLPRFIREPQPRVADQITAALTVAALFMIVPLHALATWETRHPVKGIWRTLTLLATVLAAMVTLAAHAFDGPKAGVTMLVLAAHVATVYAALRLCARATPLWQIVWMLAVLFVLWVVPILIEVIRWLFLPENRFTLESTNLTMISTFSPLGLLLVAWRNDPAGPSLLPGLCFQIAVAATMAILAARRIPPAEEAAVPAVAVMDTASR